MSITIQEMLHDKSIMGVVSRIATPLSLFQSAFQMLPGQAPMKQVVGRTASWDIFDKTRSVAGAAAPGVGPTRVNRKKIGQGLAQVMRVHESINLLDDEIFATRPLGSQPGTLDMNGQNYITNQIMYMTQRFRNLREFMVSRLFYGGFALSESGENLRPVEKGAGDFNVATQTPSTHFDQLAIGTGGADLVTATWDNASTDISTQLNNINAAMMRETGMPLRHIWVNTGVYNELLNNTKLQAQGGSVFRPFDSLNARDIRSVEGIPDSGFDVVFRAIPLYRFHVYDGVLNLSDSSPDSTDADDVTLLVKNNTAIMHPDPSPSWLGWISGSERIRRNVTDAGSIAQGFAAWATPIIDPAGQELKFLDNGLPVLTVPKAVMTPTVVF